MPGIAFIICPSMPLISGSKSIQVQVPGTTQIGTITEVPLINGNVTVSIPTGALFALIVPPVSNTLPISYGLTSGTLNAISRTAPTLESFDATAPPTSFILASNNTGTTVEVTMW